MDIAESFITMVQEKEINGQIGYGFQMECETLVGQVMKSMISSQIPPLISEKKNERDSERYRKQGNECFVEDDNMEARELFTMSLAYAKNKESMALAHSCRSAVNYRMKLFRECVLDIDASLDLDKPEDKDNRIYQRRKRAIVNLKKEASAELEKNEAPKEQLLDTASSTTNETDGSEEIIDEKKLLERQSPYTKPTYLLNQEKSTLAHGPSKESPELSQGIKISYTKQFGRHMIATEFFNPGDVLSVEEPISYMVYRDRFYTHCHQCLSVSYNLIPCPNCPLAQYCSEECRHSAWKLAHYIECPVHCVLSTLHNVDNGKMRLLTKIIRLLLVCTKNGTCIDEFRHDTKIAETNPDIRTAGFADDGQFVSQSARCAFSLATNLSSRSTDDIYAFASISALATIVLAVKTDFFGKTYKLKELEEFADLPDVQFCSGILFRASAIMSSNTFSIQQDPNVKSGGGLYVVHSLYNHSCCANTFRTFDGLKMITRALEPIVPGEQIYTCYGSGYQITNRLERQKTLKEDFFFDCECTACTEDWPTYNEILKNHIGSIAKTNKELVKKLKPMRKRLLENKYDIEAVKEVLSILYKATKMPCEEMVHGVQYLKNYYLGKLS